MSSIDIYLNEFSRVKRLLYKAYAWGLYPTIYSAVGFAYIGSPSNLQIFLRHLFPLKLRQHMLLLWTSDGWLICLFCTTIFCAIWGGVGSHVTVRLVTKKHNEVIEENDVLREESNSKSINCYKLFSNYLYGYAEQFSLGPDGRVSLYKLDMDMFSCIGRYSDNEVYKSKPSRLYPKNQGCIAKAWETGSCQNTNAPDPEADFTAWKMHNVQNFNISDEQLDKIRMHSRAFYGIRLQNTDHNAVAVLIFESLKQNGLQLSKIQKHFHKNNEIRNIVNLIESLESHMPSLEEARSEGF